MKKIKGFTLAEVLLTLAVIGIVAAITLPSLLVDTTEKAFDAQKRALHARLAQAIGMMSSLSGYGTYIEETKEGAGDGKDNAAETFLYEGLSKVYKMNNICNSENLDKCGIPKTITTMSGISINFPDTLEKLGAGTMNDNFGTDSDKSTINTKTAAFETVNGESIAVFYNPYCKSNIESGSNSREFTSSDGNTISYNYFYTANRVCVNFVYDLNGLKGPNKVGRDIGFITALYAKNSEVVAPTPFETDLEGTYTQQKAIEACLNYADDSRLPNMHELTSISYNLELIGVGGGMDGNYWSSSSVSPSLGWYQYISDKAHGNNRGKILSSFPMNVRCIRK